MSRQSKLIEKYKELELGEKVKELKEAQWQVEKLTRERDGIHKELGKMEKANA